MGGDVTVRGGWQVKDVRRHEVGHYAVPTMADTGEIDLRRFFRTVYRGKWILIMTMAATMGATTYWTLRTTPLYSADVLIVIETRPSSIVRVEESVQDLNSDAANVNTEVAVLESRGLATRVIQGLGLENDPEFSPVARDAADLAGDGTMAEAASGSLRTGLIQARYLPVLPPPGRTRGPF